MLRLPRPLLVPLALPLLLLAPACADDGPAGDDEVGDADTGETGETGTETGTETGETGTDTTGTDTGEPDREALIAELSEPGPYAVGYKDLELSYMAPGGVEPRVLPVKVWYPASPDSDAPPATYQVAGIVQLPATGALDSPAVAEGGPYPVAVYSHGSGGESLLAYPFAERFASHGWIMFSPNHVGNTTSDLLNDSSDPFIEIAVNRPADISAVLDEADGGFSGEEVAGVTDLERVFVFGHSFGGYTTLASGGATLNYQALVDSCTGTTCDFLMNAEVQLAFEMGFGDPRVDAIAPQAPALISSFEPEDLPGYEIPTMLQSGELDITTTHAAEAVPAWNALDNPDDVWVNLPFGAHYSFISICHDLDPELLAVFQPDNVNDGCGEEFTPTTETVPTLATYLLTFARLHVLDEADLAVVLEGEPLHPEFDVLMH